MNFFKNKYFIFYIFICALVMRLFFVGYHDIYTDESILSFRSIGLIDYTAAYTQKTPWQWYDSVPSWAHLSFHDHPLLFFVFQNISINIFGENVLAVRIVSVLSGAFLIFFVYHLASRIFNKKVGYLASSLLAVQSYHLWISRIGLQDGLVLFFMFAILFLWILALKKDKFFVWLLWGGVLGLGFLTKYTIFIIVPILLLYAFIFKNKFYKNKLFWMGATFAIILFSPVLFYNFFLYKDVGHFDLQISSILGQETPNWPAHLGRAQSGDLGDRFFGFFKTMNFANSIVLNIISVLSLFFCIYIFIKNKSKELLFLLISVFIIFTWFLLIGSTSRFVVMIIPWIILLIAYSIYFLWEKTNNKKIFFIGFVVFFIFEFAFSINTFFIHPSLGKENITYAKINETTKNFGFNELDSYLNNILDKKFPVATGNPKYGFLLDLQEKNIQKAKNRDNESYNLIVVYDREIYSASKLWYLQRRMLYNGWIFMSDEEFLNITGDNLDNYYRKQGIENFIYIKVNSNIDFPFDIASKNFKSKENGDMLEKYLIGKNVIPDSILNSLGLESFFVYKF
jgi:4-amino-4-deoxy-L-arabinose transferase-like glycosyltransferase